MRIQFWVSACAVGIIAMWPSAFNSTIVNQMNELLKKFLAKNLHVTSAFLWSFFVSCRMLFVVVGYANSSWLIDKFGRKGTIVLASVPAVLALFLQFMSYPLEHPILLFSGKMLVGFVAGVHGAAASVFLSETSPNDDRGARSATAPLLYAIGYFIAAVLCIDSLMGNAALWNYIFLIPLCTAFLCLLYFFYRGNGDLTKESINFYCSRGKHDELTDEQMDLFLQQSIAEIETENENLESKESCWTRTKELFADKRLRISSTISVAMAVNHATSSFVLLSCYSTAILESLGMPTTMAKKFTVLLAASTVVAASMANYLVEKIGRRPLLIAGTFLASILLSCLGGVCQMGKPHPSMTLHWMAALAIILCSFVGRSSICTLFSVLIPEIFPFRTWSGARAFTGLLYNFLGFVVLFLFYPLFQICPLLAFGFVAFPTFLCGIIFWKLCPETKGKGVDLILAEINGEIYDRVDDKQESKDNYSFVKNNYGTFKEEKQT